MKGRAPKEMDAGSEGLTPAQRRALAQIWAVLPQARLVGGVVRDLLMGRSVADVDMATPETPEQVQDTLTAAGIKVVPTGLSHGTVTAVIASAPYEITTLRRDMETDGRHAVVCWTADWREDAARRDFTINAMSRSRDGALHDYFGGQADLAQGLVRFVGDAGTRIEEDALRILRFFRFQGRYGTGEPDAEAMRAITQRVGLITRLSVERVWSELQRILTGPNAATLVAMMAEAGVLSVILPQGFALGRFIHLVQAGAPADAVLRLAALVEGSKLDVAQHLKLSRADTAFLLAVSEGPVPETDATDAALRRFLADEPARPLIGRTWLRQATLLADAEVGQTETVRPDARAFEALRKRLEGIPRPVFPVAGRDIVAAGHAPGPAVGQVLARVRNWWMAEGCTASREACLDRLRHGFE